MVPTRERPGRPEQAPPIPAKCFSSVSVCSAKELESLPLTTDPQAKKGTKADMATRILACVGEITVAAAPTPATAPATATEE